MTHQEVAERIRFLFQNSFYRSLRHLSVDVKDDLIVIEGIVPDYHMRQQVISTVRSNTSRFALKVDVV